MKQPSIYKQMIDLLNKEFYTPRLHESVELKMEIERLEKELKIKDAEIDKIVEIVKFIKEKEK